MVLRQESNLRTAQTTKGLAAKNMLNLSMQRNFTPMFCGLSVKTSSFKKVHYFASFLRNFALNSMQISYL